MAAKVSEARGSSEGPGGSRSCPRGARNERCLGGTCLHVDARPRGPRCVCQMNPTVAKLVDFKAISARGAGVRELSDSGVGGHLVPVLAGAFTAPVAMPTLARPSATRFLISSLIFRVSLSLSYYISLI